jgi:hypothetical protein
MVTLTVPERIKGHKQNVMSWQSTVISVLWHLTTRGHHFIGTITCLLHSELPHSEEKNWQRRQQTGLSYQHCTSLHWLHLTEGSKKWTWIVLSLVVNALRSNGGTLTWSINIRSLNSFNSKIPTNNTSEIGMFQQIMRHSEINGSEYHKLNTKADWCIKYGEVISWFR